jgi:Nuclease-related domain
MLLKPRPVPTELIILRSLNTRMFLTAKEKLHYSNLEKGYEGEVLFDQLIEKLQSEMLVLNDLFLEVNKSVFQIDTLTIAQESIYLIDVKNYEGDYYYESDTFYTQSGEDLKNPLHQLQRCETLLRQLLQNHGYKFPIKSYLVFINPEFTLYQAPRNLPIIYPTQVNRFLKKLKKEPAKLSTRHTKLADLLIAAHQIKSPYPWLPAYEYSQLKKGITCTSCHSFTITAGERKIVCAECGCQEEVSSAVLRLVQELKLLFPDIKITTNTVHEWFKVIESKKKINRILTQLFRREGHGKFSYYVNK